MLYIYIHTYTHIHAIHTKTHIHTYIHTYIVVVVVYWPHRSKTIQYPYKVIATLVHFTIIYNPPSRAKQVPSTTLGALEVWQYFMTVWQYTYVRIHTYVYVRTYVYVHTYIRTYTYTHTCIQYTYRDRRTGFFLLLNGFWAKGSRTPCWENERRPSSPKDMGDT